MRDIIIAVLLVLLIIVPVIAAVIAFIHAVIDSVKNKRFPNIIAMLLLLLGIGLLAVQIYGDKLYAGVFTGGIRGEYFLCFAGLHWSGLRIVLQGLAFVFSVTGLAWYIFLSFREDSVLRFRKKKFAKGQVSGDEDTGDALQADTQEVETEEDIRKSNRKTALLYRILTVSVAVVLSGVMLAYCALMWYYTNLIQSHDLVEYTSPDGQYTIVVDNLLEFKQIYGGDIYLRVSPFKVRRLKEIENRRKYMDIKYEDIQWEDQGIRIPYGNVNLFYYYEPVEQTD